MLSTHAANTRVPHKDQISAFEKPKCQLPEWAGSNLSSDWVQKLPIEIKSCENQNKCQIAETVQDMKCWKAENVWKRLR